MIIVYRGSIKAMPNECADLKKALYGYLTGKTMPKGHPQRKKFLRMYQAFLNAEKRWEDDK